MASILDFIIGIFRRSPNWLVNRVAATYEVFRNTPLLLRLIFWDNAVLAALLAKGVLDVSLLLALDALLRDENVTHATARLNISQSALSGRLNKLRQILNDPLFLPASKGRGVTATPHALALKAELDQLLERLKQFGQKTYVFNPSSSDRTFKIAASGNPAAIIAPDLLPHIHKRAPGIKIAFIFRDRPTIGEHLERGDVDPYIGPCASDRAAQTPADVCLLAPGP